MSVVNGIEESVNNENKDLNGTTIMLHNIQGLLPHYRDLKCQREMMELDFICLTETWIKADQMIDVNFDGFKSFHQIRALSYNDNMKTLHQQRHGGVGVYGKTDTHFSRLNLTVQNVEYVAFHIISHVSIVVVVIYRPPSYKMKDFIDNLLKLIIDIHKVSSRCIVMGDFNENIYDNHSQI